MYVSMYCKSAFWKWLKYSWDRPSSFIFFLNILDKQLDTVWQLSIFTVYLKLVYSCNPSSRSFIAKKRKKAFDTLQHALQFLRKPAMKSGILGHNNPKKACKIPKGLHNQCALRCVFFYNTCSWQVIHKIQIYFSIAIQTRKKTEKDKELAY